MKYYLKQIKSFRDILPVLMVLITKEDRYLPENLDFNWKGNVVHSLLMCYYKIFWRRVGVRHGGLSFSEDSNGIKTVRVRTKFGVLLFIEHFIIRKTLGWRPIKVEIFQPVLAYPGGLQGFNPSPFLFAVAWSASHSRASGNSTSPALASVSTTGSDRLLFSSYLLEANGTTFSSGPTFGGSNFTQYGGYVNTGDGAQSFSSWRLVNPSTSSGSITGTISTSTPWTIWADSYTGVDQTTPVANVSSAGASGGITASPFNVQITSARDGSLQFTIAKTDSGAAPLTTTAGATARQLGPSTVTYGDWEGSTSTANGASNTMTFTYAGGGQRAAWISGMLQPPAAAGPANLKTYDTNPKANIKTMNTNPIANVKTFDTNA